MFASLYNRILNWAGHRYALRFLLLFSFVESIIFPIPTDVMLVPVVLRSPKRAFYLASLTTLASVVGGLVGYALGAYGFELLAPWLHELGYWEKYQQVIGWFGVWGVWIVLIAGFSPLPYKLFTISAGVLSLGLFPFILASVVGRGARFYLVAKVVAVFGPKLEPVIRQYIEWFGWAAVLLVGTIIIYYTAR